MYGLNIIILQFLSSEKAIAIPQAGRQGSKKKLLNFMIIF